MIRMTVCVAALLALLVAGMAATVRAQTPPPRGTDAPAEFEFTTFSNRLIESQKLLGERRVHFVFLVDVTASVANDLLDFWRRDVFLPMCEKFLVSGDRVTIVPFGMRANWLDATVAQPYQRTDIANIVARFPRRVMDSEDKGTDIYGSIGEVLEAAEKKGWANDNLFIIVLTDDQIQESSTRSNQKFERLRAKYLEGNPSFAARYAFTKRRQPKDYSIYAFSNSFPDKTPLPKTRLQQVVGERSGGAGTSGGTSGGGTTGGSPEAGGSPGASPAASPSTSAQPSPSPSGAATARHVPSFPWWLLGVAIGLLLLVWMLFKPVGFRYRIDGAPGKIRSSDRPVPVALSTQPQEPVADLKVSGGRLTLVPRKGFSVPGKSGAATRQSGSRPRSGAAPAAPAPIPLAAGSRGEYRAHELEIVRDATASGAWAQAAPGAQKVGTVKIEVAELGAAPARGQASGSKKGAKP